MKLYHITWLPAFLLMVIIFLFSSKPAVNSNENSMVIAESILTAYETVYDVQYEQQERFNILESINYFIRKLSHFCEYAALGFAFALHLRTRKLNGKWMLFLPVLLAAAYAATDEFHQTFVPGRSGRLSDVLLDTSGAVAGTALFLMVGMVRKKFRNDHETIGNDSGK